MLIFTRRYLLAPLSFFLLLAGSDLSAQSIVGFYPLPDQAFFNSAWGLASDSQFVYISSRLTGSQEGYIFKFDLDGNRIDSIATGLDDSQGLAWDGSHFWYFKRATPATIYKLTPDGVRVDSFLTGTSFCGGVGWDGSGIWYSVYFPDADAGFYKIDPNTLTVVDTIAVFPLHKQPHSITYDGQYYYYSVDDFSGDPKGVFIYDDVLGDTVGQVPLLDPISQNPRGVVWDGQHLWLIADAVGATSYSLFKFDLAGGGVPNISLSEDQYDFQNVVIGTNPSHTFFVNNLGTDTLEINNFTNSNPTVFPATTPSNIIPPGSNASFDVSFDPSDFGRDSTLIQISSNDINDPVLDVWVFGTGIFAEQDIELSESGHDFGSVWTNNTPSAEGQAVWNLVVSNRGASPLEITNVTNSLPEFGFLGNPDFPVTIDSVGDYLLRVAFTPSGPGDFEDTLLISSDDPDEPLISVPVTGFGDTTALDLGSVMWSYQVPDHPATGFDDFRVVAMKTIKDVSGDGYEDVVLGSENYWILCINGNGAGVTDTIWKFSTYESNFSAGSLGSTGELPSLNKALGIADDLNSDGKEDVVIGIGGGNERVYALDGLDGSVLWKFGTDHPDSFGLGDINSVRVDEDLNGDLVPDVIATGSGANDGLEGRRRVYAFDGTNGNMLWFYFLGTMVRDAVSLGNADGSGGIDVAVATGNGTGPAYGVVGFDSQPPASQIWFFPISSNIGGGKELLRYDVPGETADVIAGTYTNLGGGGMVYRIDGATGTQVWAYNVNRAVMQLSLINDVNNDGFDDILVSILDTDIAGGPGVFYCLSGATGQPVWSKVLGDATYGGRAISDLNGDGLNDAVAACRNDSVYALDGSDGTIFFRYGINSGELQGATAVYTIEDLDNNNSEEILVASDGGQVYAISGGGDGVVGIRGNDRTAGIPDKIELFQNYPNPFNPSTTIRFTVPFDADVNLSVYNILGQKVNTLLNGRVTSGEHRIEWDGINTAGSTVSSGVYVYRLSVAESVKAKKMLFIR